ncbi:MAG: undecaprenyl-diphosphatase, partial [Pseudoleptotrichia goodfellowii]|nr:undecaprenyl-diphosphatase [Pseudoleptotrichia goodfellowii]
FLIGLGFVLSFVFAYGVIKVFMDYIKKHDFKVFGYYRIILGIIVFALYFTGVIK